MSHQPVIGDANVGLNGMVRCNHLRLLSAFEVLVALLINRFLILRAVADNIFWARSFGIIDQSAADLPHVIQRRVYFPRVVIAANRVVECGLPVVAGIHCTFLR